MVRDICCGYTTVIKHNIGVFCKLCDFRPLEYDVCHLMYATSLFLYNGSQKCEKIVAFWMTNLNKLKNHTLRQLRLIMDPKLGINNGTYKGFRASVKTKKSVLKKLINKTFFPVMTHSCYTNSSLFPDVVEFARSDFEFKTCSARFLKNNEFRTLIKCMCNSSFVWSNKLQCKMCGKNKTWEHIFDNSCSFVVESRYIGLCDAVKKLDEKNKEVIKILMEYDKRSNLKIMSRYFWKDKVSIQQRENATRILVKGIKNGKIYGIYLLNKTEWSSTFSDVMWKSRLWVIGKITWNI